MRARPEPAAAAADGSSSARNEIAARYHELLGGYRRRRALPARAGERRACTATTCSSCASGGPGAAPLSCRRRCARPGSARSSTTSRSTAHALYRDARLRRGGAERCRTRSATTSRRSRCRCTRASPTPTSSACAARSGAWSPSRCPGAAAARAPRVSTAPPASASRTGRRRRLSPRGRAGLRSPRPPAAAARGRGSATRLAWRLAQLLVAVVRGHEGSAAWRSRTPIPAVVDAPRDATGRRPSLDRGSRAGPARSTRAATVPVASRPRARPERRAGATQLRPPTSLPATRAEASVRGGRATRRSSPPSPLRHLEAAAERSLGHCRRLPDVDARAAAGERLRPAQDAAMARLELGRAQLAALSACSDAGLDRARSTPRASVARLPRCRQATRRRPRPRPSAAESDVAGRPACGDATGTSVLAVLGALARQEHRPRRHRAPGESRRACLGALVRRVRLWAGMPLCRSPTSLHGARSTSSRGLRSARQLARHASALAESARLLDRARRLIPAPRRRCSKGPTQWARGCAVVRGARRGLTVCGRRRQRVPRLPDGARPVILGYATPPSTRRSAPAQGRHHLHAAPPARGRGRRADRALVPCAERVRFGKTGSDATCAASASPAPRPGATASSWPATTAGTTGTSARLRAARRARGRRRS